MSEKMKDSGVSWIGEIPEGWEVKKFKYFFETTKGLSITKEKLTDKGIPVISYGQIHSKYGRKVDSTKDLLPFVPEDYLRYKQALLTKGNFIFADTSEDIEGSGNFSTRTDGEGRLFAGYHTIIARLLDTKNNDFRYFMYLFDSEWFRNQIRHSVSGVKVFSITQSILKNTTILFPISLAEQKAVADYLDKQTSKFDQAQKLLKDEIERLRAYKKSLIYETVTKGLDKNVQFKDSGMDWIGEIPEDWEVSPLKFLTTKIGSGKTPLGGAETYLDEGIMLLRSQNIYSEALRLDDVVRISEEVFREMQSTSVNKNDVLLNITGASIGRVGFYDLDEKANVNQHVSIIRTKIDFLSPKYLFYVLQSSVGQNYISTYQFGGNREGLNFQQIGNFRLPVPELTIQEEISKYLDEKTNKIDQIIKIKEQQLTNLSEQRKTLIYEVVTGKRKINV
ncbi:restriction endonuclease subunit S [Lactococcus ileimucosae]|uniref:Restriction endonuclease subunit S n=1 Tax=Lactococcus ileimucosae TaxID=2941329 RepID=A0ABV4D3A8_9LACT